jgi:broad specificity phosphatase PhoE
MGQASTGRARIHLVRHGRSAHRHDGSWVSADGVRHFENAYNAASIRDDDVPPRDVFEAVTTADVIAASDMSRAIASARRIAPTREVAVSPLLREIELETPRWVPVPLPMVIWDTYTFLQWSYRLLREADHENVRRARAATDWLLERASDSSTVLAITHGAFRRLLDASLVARGWRRAPGKQSYENWSTWSYLLP